MERSRLLTDNEKVSLAIQMVSYDAKKSQWKDLTTHQNNKIIH